MKRNALDLAANYSLQKLKNELLPQLHYHCLEHTRDEVVVWAERLADLEKIEVDDRQILLTAAYFHDLGWTQVKNTSELEYLKRHEHEFLGAELARSVLPEFGYQSREIDEVCNLIMVTRLDEKPVKTTEKILRDADLSSIGQGVELFWKRGNDLRAEMAEFGICIDDFSWNMVELNLLQGMTYFTDSARHLFDGQKQAALESVRALLGNK